MKKGEQPQEGEIILYTTPEGTARVEVFFQDETFWLSQRRMADLFGVEVPTINHQDSKASLHPWPGLEE